MISSLTGPLTSSGNMNDAACGPIGGTDAALPLRSVQGDTAASAYQGVAAPPEVMGAGNCAGINPQGGNHRSGERQAAEGAGGLRGTPTTSRAGALVIYDDLTMKVTRAAPPEGPFAFDFPFATALRLDTQDLAFLRDAGRLWVVVAVQAEARRLRFVA